MAPQPQPTPAPGKLYRFAWGLYLVLALAGVLWIGAKRGVIPLSLFIDSRHWWLDLALGLGSGFLLLAVWWGAERALPLARELEARLARALGPLSVSEAVALALLSGFAEELFFRGAVQGAAGWLAATLLFALLHSGPGRAFRLWSLFALIAGGLFGAVMIWRGNLLGPVVGHCMVNAINLRRLTSRASDSVRLPAGEAARDEKET
ncbi:MAG TPA: CPBP family intramembrane glutamic endopeptidase [Thermoanaerobaculia bacterium]|nr:CPBP family intramembrane glutamic endopeptidase [Thermoanaerobaculia bacterium]